MRGAWGARALVLVFVIACAAAFTPLVDGLGWLARPLAIELVAALGMAITATVARGRGWPLLVGAIVHVLGVTVAFAASSAIVGVIPTPGTVDRLIGLGRLGSNSIVEQAVPARPDEGIVFLLALGLAGLALALEVLVFIVRAPALAALPVLVVSAVPNLIDPATVQVPLFVVLAAAYVGLLLVRRPRSSPGTRIGAVAAGAVVVVGSLVVAAVLPPIEPPDAVIDNGRGYSLATNVFSDLGQDLRRPDPITAFTYTTDDALTPYFTLDVLDQLVGTRWQATQDRVGGDDLASIGPDPSRATDATVTDTTSSVTIGDIGGRALPAPYAATSVTGLDGPWLWDAGTLAISTNAVSIRHQQYEVQSQVATPTEQELEAAGTTVDPDMEQYLQIAPSAPAVIRQTAERVARDANATDFYEIAEALQGYFQGGDFTYSTEAPVERGYDEGDASGLQVIAQFLDQKAGYCVHFSSAMALMARSLGIPARIGVGFTAGERTGSVDGVPQYTVTTDDLHAWPELYFHGVGWVRFEPTPGIGNVPVFPDDEQNPTSPATSSSGPTDSPSSTSTSSATTPSQLPSDEPADGPGSSQGMVLPRGLVEGVLAGLVLVLIVIAPGVTRAIRRRRRLGRARTGDALVAWLEVSDSAVDLGIPVFATQSARGLAQVLSERAGPDADAALGRLLAAVEASAYGPDAGAPAVDVADVAALRRALAKSARASDRLRAIVLPRSLLPTGG